MELPEPLNPEPDDTLTMAPLPCSCMAGVTARAIWNAPTTLTSRTRRKSSEASPSRSWCGTITDVAALFTSPSMRPHWSSAAAAIRRQSSSTDTSAWHRMASPPAARHASADALASASLLV